MAKKDKDGVVSVEKLSEESVLNNREYNAVVNKLFTGMSPGNTVTKMQNEARNINKEKFTVTNNASKKIEDEFSNSAKFAGVSENTFGDNVKDESTQDDLSSTNKDIIVRPMNRSNGTVEELFKNSTKSTLKMQSAMMEQNIKLAKTTFTSLNKMHKSMHDVSTFQRTVQASYYKTSLSYKKDMLEELKKITAILKTGFSIKEESKGKYSINNKAGNDNENNILNQLFSGRPGGVFKGLKNAVRATAVKQMSGGAYSDMFDMAQAFLPLLEGMNGKSMLRMAASGFASKQFEKHVGVRQSENIKNWMSDPRNMISNFAKSMMTSNNQLLKDFFSNFVDGNATSGATKTFNIKEYMKRDPQGRAVFNNMTQRSITHIIPYHLANIEGFMGHLSRSLGDKKDGPRVHYYDYGTNKFENIKDIEKIMGHGAGANFKKVVRDVTKEYTNEKFNPIKDLLDAQDKYQSEFLKKLNKDPKKIAVIGGDIISLCTIAAQSGIDIYNLLNMRTPSPDEIISMGVYSYDMDKKQMSARAHVLSRFIAEIKKLRTEDSKWLLDDIFGSVAERLRAQYEKDTDEIENLANNSVSAWAHVANEKNKDFNTRFGSGYKGFKEKTSGHFDMKRWHDHFKKSKEKKYKDVKFDDIKMDQQTIEIEAAKMSGRDYGIVMRQYYELKNQVESMRENGDDKGAVFKGLEAQLKVMTKAREMLEKRIGIENIEADRKKFAANGYKTTKTKLEFTGDIGSDFSTFKKWASEYISTTGGKREANLALSGAAGAAIWKLTSSMGAGKVMAPIMGVVGGSALLMSGKLKGVIDVLGEGGDIMMDNGKSRRENLMTRIMQDALPAGLGAATGIKVSNFIKNHLRFGTILGPILGTVTGTAIYAIGKSGLFKGLLKGLTWLPRMLFKKIFGKDAYDAAGKWINDKTGGYFSKDKDVPSYKEIMNATTDSKSLKAAQGAAIKFLDDMKDNETVYVNKIIKKLMEQSKAYKHAASQNRNMKRFTEKELDNLGLSESELEKIYKAYKDSVHATTTINQIHDIIQTAMRDRDLANKMNNVAYGNTDNFGTKYEKGKTKFHGHTDNDSDAFKDMEDRASKFNERFNGAKTEENNDNENNNAQDDGTGGAGNSVKNRSKNNRDITSNVFSRGRTKSRHNRNDIKKFMDERGCAAFVANELMSELTGSTADPAQMYDSTLEYQRGKGVHYSYFTDFAKRLNLRYRITDMARPDLEEIAKMLIADANKAYHILLTSDRPGHGHFILVWDIRNDKYMSCKVYDPLRPNLDRNNLASLLYNTKKIITIFKGDKVKSKSFNPKTSSSKDKSSNSSVDEALNESTSKSAKLTGSSLSRKYAKGAVTDVSPIPVVIIGGHLDAVGNIGSIDMEGYKERVRMLAQDSSSGSSLALKHYAGNVFSNYGKNKYNDEQKTKQDSLEEYAKENNEIMKKGFGVTDKKDKKDNKDKKKGLLGGLIGGGLAALASLFGGKGIGGLPGLVFNGIKTLGGGVFGLGKNVIKRFFGKGTETAGESILNSNGQAIGRGIKNIGGKIGSKLYESAFGSVTKEVVTRDVKLLGRKVGEKTVTRTVEKSGFLTNVVKKIADVIPKVVEKLEKAPLIGKFIKKHDLGKKLVDLLPKMMKKGAEEVAEEGAEAATKQAAKNTTSAVSGKTGIGAIISAGFVIYDGVQAWHKAPKFFNTASPTLLQKVCAGIVGVTLSAINAFLAVDPMTIICISLLQMSDTIMGMMAKFLYGFINSFVKEKPGTGSGDVTQGDNARFTKDEDGNIVDNPDHKGVLGGIFEKNTSQIVGDLLTGAASKLIPAGLDFGNMVIGLLGGIFNALVAGTGYALSNGDNSNSSEPNHLENGQGMFITNNGNTYGGNNSGSTTGSDTTQQGQGSGVFGGRGDEGATTSGVGYGTTKSSINGLTFVSQGQFMANKSMNGESLTQNGCAISAMKMVALHLGMKITDNELIKRARDYLDRSTNAVDINYFTSFGGTIMDDVISVKTSIANPGSAVVLLVYKGEGQHFVALINKGGNMYLGDPEESDYIPTDLNDFYLNSFISAVIFENAHPFGGGLITGGRGRRRRLGGRASGVKSLGFTADQSKLVKGIAGKVGKMPFMNKKSGKPESLYTVQQTIGGPGGGTNTGGANITPTTGGLSFSASQVKDNGGWKWDSLPSVSGKGYNAMKPLIDGLSGHFGIPSDAITAMMYLESGLNPNARTGSYVGLGQLNSESWNAALHESMGGLKYNGAAYGVPAIGAGGVLNDPRMNGTIFLARMAHDAKVLEKNGVKDVSTGMLHMTHMLPTSLNYIGKSNPNLLQMSGVKRSYIDGNAPLTTTTGTKGGAALSLNDSINKFNQFHIKKLAEAKAGRGSGRFNRRFSGRGIADIFKQPGGGVEAVKRNLHNNINQQPKKPSIFTSGKPAQLTAAQKAVERAKVSGAASTNISIAQTGVANTGLQASNFLRPKWLEIAIGENGNSNASKYNGTPGKWCMDFVNWCFKQAGYSDIPNDSSSQAPVASDKWAKIKGAVPGCVIVLARGSGKGKAADQDGASIGGGHSMFYIGPGEGPGATWKVCTGNPQVRVKDYHIAQSGKTFVGYFIPKSALKDLHGAKEIPKTEQSDINNQSAEGGGSESGAANQGGGVDTNVVSKGKFITSSGKVFNVTKLIAGAMQALGKIMSGSPGGGQQGNNAGGGTVATGAMGSLGLSQSQDMVKGAPIENGSTSVKDNKAVKVAEYIKTHIGTTGGSSCGAAVGNGLEAVFKISLKRERDASSFFAAKVLGGSGFGHRNETGNADKMKSIGYKVISCASTPQAGDIICFNDPKRPAWYGHICCLASDGIWYSYFKQKSFYVYGAPKEQAKFTLWRYTEGVGGDENDGIEPSERVVNEQKPVLSGLGFKSTANVKMLPKTPNLGSSSNSLSSIGFGNNDKLTTNKGVWNSVSRVNKVNWDGSMDINMAEFKKSLDKLNNTMLTGISVNKDILKASVDQMGILGDLSNTAKKQYKLSQQRIKSITLDGKDEDNFKKLQAKLNEWTNSLRKDYNVAVEDY